MPSLQRHWLLRFTQKLQHPGECAGRRWRVERRQTERRNDVCEDRDVLFGDGSRIVEVEFVRCIHRLDPTKWQSAFAKAHDKMLCEVLFAATEQVATRGCDDLEVISESR